MNDKMIKQILDSYYNGTATEEEIQTIEEFFARTDIPEHWEPERTLFLQVRAAETIPLPEGLESRLERVLDKHIARRKRFRLNGYTYRIAGVAAVLLLCLGIAFYPFAPKTTADTFQDPEEAALVAGKALALLSNTLNSGIGQVAEAEKNIQEINQIVNSQLK
jgi:hypothetical protein